MAAADALAHGPQDPRLKRDVFIVAIGIVIGLAAARAVGAVVDDLIMPFVTAFLGDPGTLTLNAWRIHLPFGHLLRELIEFTAVAGVLLTIVRVCLKRM
jgi:large-conductance mechanosensitive channel